MTHNSTWPLYNYQWAAGTIGPSSVGFNDELGNTYYDSEEYYNYVLHVFPGEGRYVDVETDGSAAYITIQLNRTGDLSGSYSVPVTISDGIDAHAEILSVQPAAFTAGQSTANMTIAIDRAFLDDLEYDEFTVTIDPSANYGIMGGASEYRQEFNVG